MSEGLDIDQDLAKRLLVEGGTLVFLGVPPGTEFGIDMKSWNTGQKFKGVKMIPPGLHYIHYSATNKEGDAAPRAGFLHNFQKSEFVVKKWCKETEDISSEEVSEEQINHMKADVMNLDRYLGAYPFDIWKRWKKLTENITVDLVQKLSPLSGRILSALDLTSEEFKGSKQGSSPPAEKRRRSRPSTMEEKEEDLLPNLKPLPGTELRFTEFPLQNFPEGASPAEITQHSLDSTYVLNIMLTKHKRPTDLIGELEFAFVCFLVGHSLEAFEHWKRLVDLLCSCEEAVTKQREVFDKFLTVIEDELREVPEDFLVDIVARNNFIYHCLRKFFRTLHQSDTIDGRLKSKANRLQERLTAKFQWDFSCLDEEEDDEAPVVVEES